ncbi:MAG: ABC transporter permease [Planctomycetes bacterium]|nr:ABC transporter permease [Planctomycetota bacterium]
MTLGYAGRLDSVNVGSLWRQTSDILKHARPARVIVLGEEIDYCDGSGVGLLFSLRLKGVKQGFAVEFKGLRPELAEMLDRFDADRFAEYGKEKRHIHPAEEIGHFTWQLFLDLREQFAFIGELHVAAVRCLVRRGQLRWKEVFITAERAGANAVGIVSLIGFLFGLIMAFSFAMPMRQFGVDIYVADLVAMGLVRVLGPFITAIILAGRSGSAYAAELGTMKINDEIDALTTMSLNPVRFLVVPKVLATIFVTPLLTVVANVFGLIGCGVVMLSLGFPLVTYTSHVESAIDAGDVALGLFKALVFGGLVAGVGCLRGLQTETGPSAVGISTTRAVVSGIVLVVLAEGVFAVLFHYMDI